MAEQAGDLLQAAAAENSPLLGYLASLTSATREIHEAIAANANTPDEAIALLARATEHASLIELITFNQQRLIRSGDYRRHFAEPGAFAEAERRAKETRQEFLRRNAGRAKSRKSCGRAETPRRLIF
jgi:hypothetical protein